MFNFFGGKGNHFFGIDLGGSAVKAVELAWENNQIKLLNYAWVDFGEKQSGGELDNQSIDKMVEASLRKIIDKMESETKKVYAAIPGFSGLINVIEMPNMKKEEAEKVIEYEAYKYIPISLDEVYLSWDVLDMEKTKNESNFSPDKSLQSENGEKMKVLLVAAPKSDVNKYEAMLEKNGLKISSMELDTFSASRSLVGSDMGSYLIIEIGARTTTIVAVKKGNVIMNHNLYIGGNELTKNIAKGMNVSWSRAEKYKKEKKDIINTVQSGINFSALGIIAGEAGRILRVFQEREKIATIDSVIVSGGSAKMTGILKYFEKELGKNVVLGDPWKKIKYNEKLKEAIENMGSTFSVAIGAALKGLEDYQRSAGN